eukprot:g4682.t1
MIMDETQSACPSASRLVARDYKDEMLELSTTLGLVFDHPANGHYPSDVGRDSGVELTCFNSSRGLNEEASFFPDNFCIGEDGEDLTYCLGPDLEGENTTFENFSLDEESAFVIKLVNFQENTSQLCCDNESPSFDFSEFMSKLSKENDSWKKLESKAQNLLVKSKPEQSKVLGSPMKNVPPKRKLEMISNEKKSSTPIKEQHRLSAAESHRRATAKRTRIQGRFKRRQHVWVNIGEDGRKIAE